MYFYEPLEIKLILQLLIKTSVFMFFSKIQQTNIYNIVEFVSVVLGFRTIFVFQMRAILLRRVLRRQKRVNHVLLRRPP